MAAPPRLSQSASSYTDSYSQIVSYFRIADLSIQHPDL